MRSPWLAAAVTAVLVLAGCGGSDRQPTPAETTHGHYQASETPQPGEPLRDGERFLDLSIPEPYQPKAPTANGDDDYRCFLLDPKLDDDAFITGHDVLPGTKALVHHVILYRVEADAVGHATELDERTEGQGWTCFGGPGVRGGSELGPDWLGAWAPGGGESIYDDDIGVPLRKGERVVMQVHYNLLDGIDPVTSATRLRLADGSSDLEPLRTRPLPGPVELPCRPGTKGRLCDREAAVRDVSERFGARAGFTVVGLQAMCGGNTSAPEASPVQTCDHRVGDGGAIRAAAGHMHLLGRSISITLNPGTPRERVVLDIPRWDFDNQATRMMKKPIPVTAGDTLRVRCRHDQALRDDLPAFEGQKERYVVWGDGTRDEMCLGIVMMTSKK